MSEKDKFATDSGSSPVSGATSNVNVNPLRRGGSGSGAFGGGNTGGAGASGSYDVSEADNGGNALVPINNNSSLTTNNREFEITVPSNGAGSNRLGLFASQAAPLVFGLAEDALRKHLPFANELLDGLNLSLQDVVEMSVERIRRRHGDDATLINKEEAEAITGELLADLSYMNRFSRDHYMIPVVSADSSVTHKELEDTAVNIALLNRISGLFVNGLQDFIFLRTALFMNTESLAKALKWRDGTSYNEVIERLPDMASRVRMR